MAHLETDPETWQPLRTSAHINRRPAANIHHAVRIADHIGLPLNQLVTVNFDLTASGGTLASRRFATLRTNYYGKWITRPRRECMTSGVPPTFVWSLERGGGVLSAHWLVHVPPARLQDFKGRLPEWIQAVAGDLLSPNALHIQAAATPRSASKYLLKGIDPAYAAFYGIRHEPQGIVAGRRSGMSRNLGPAVKRRLRENGEYQVARWTRPFPGARPSAAMPPSQ